MALPEHGAAGNFRRMRREDWNDMDLPQCLRHLFKANACAPNAKQRALECSRLWRNIRRKLRRTPPAFSMVRFSQVGQFEVDRKGLREFCRLRRSGGPDNFS